MMAIGFIGAINFTLLFVLPVAVQVSFQVLWCVLSKWL